ncbi:uncharacterized protein si:ch211-14c7.2 [Takifugu flavidus]|uniref:Uncharacterized protein n=1 Tax=Takifugu flavidus TaxID=433684 RepID=A0A5C6PF42_9TELE|nr:uncharacterized protein si:ch211-14c7.2 [Takifugu flavidus]TWW76820.1 hypothetical protein D4764_12G0002100 [Takifugu flavidus]
MRPTTSIMLQQNNNNNYPCLNGLDSTPEMLQKCSRTSLPFSRALELGLADLPLIRGLRAWALCSKNRRKAGGVLAGGQAPISSPARHRSSTACPRAADVYLSREWGHMAYGLPFGPDAGQAGIRALVTVASLKTSEGSGKTQTQCLFLQTEKGSCLYSAGKPVSGGSAASSVVGGWLKGKTGAKGCREIPVRQRDQGPTSVSESRANVRVRSGRRWRKSCKAASKEKKEVNRDGQQRWREDPDAEVTLDERQEEEHNGCVEGKQFPNPLHVRRVRQEKEEVLQSPICFHDVSANGCIECGRKAQRGDSPTRSTSNRQKSDTHPQRKDGEEEKRVVCELESSVFQVLSSDPDLETNKLQPESNRNSDITKFARAKSEEELNTQNDGCSGKEDTDPEVIKAHTDQSSEQVRGDFALSSSTEENLINEERTEEGMMGLDATEEKEKITQISAEFLVVSGCSEDDSVSNPPLYIRDDLSPIDVPLEGSIHNVLSEGLVQSDQESGTQCLEKCEQGLAEHQIRGKEELNITKFDQQEQNSAAVQDNTVTKRAEPLLFSGSNQNSSLQEDSSDSAEAILKTESALTATNSHNLSTTACSGKVHQMAPEEKEDDHRESPDKVGEDGVIWRGHTPDKLNVSGGRGNDVGEYAIYDLEENGIREDNAKDVTENCALRDNWRSPVSAEQCRINEETPGTCGQTSRIKVGANSEISANVSHAAYTDLSTSLTLSRANPAHFLPLLESMTTDLPLLEVKKEEEGERVGLLLREESQEGKSSPRRELEEPGEEKRGCTVASEQESKDEEEEEEDEFGIFMQAEGESAWSEGLTMPASVPCRSRESVELGNHAICEDPVRWTADSEDHLFQQSDNTWTAFTQDSSAQRQDVMGQWWPTSAVEERVVTNQNVVAVFAEAFPSLPGSSSSDPCDLGAVSTLTQILREKASQEKGLLDSFHDLNKIICQRFTKANGISRELLLKTLQLEQHRTESLPTVWTANRRLSPGLPTAHQHTHNAAAKRRLSYDYNRNIMV